MTTYITQPPSPVLFYVQDYNLVNTQTPSLPIPLFIYSFVYVFY